jgi:uncharacterized delta-60 repeat protein
MQHLRRGLLLVLLCVARTAVGADGELDPTFGTQGAVVTPLLGGDAARAVVVQPDGNLVVAGTANQNAGPRFALARYTASGALDPAFGSGGVVYTGFSSGVGKANALLLQPDGRLVAIGGRFQYPTYPSDSALQLVRYEPDGSLDQSFGTGGGVVTVVTGVLEEAQDGALTPDGHIVVVGATGFYPDGIRDAVVARYGSDGALDASFGSGGIVVTGLGAGIDAEALGVALQPDGRIVAVGDRKQESDEAYDWLLLRYEPDGSLDQSFGAGGVVTTDFGTGLESYEFARAVALQSDGKIVVTGVTADARLALARYEVDGTLDESFGTSGIVVAPWRDSDGTDVLLQPDGKIVVAGYRDTGPGAPSVTPGFLVARFLADGRPDPDFAVCGNAVDAIVAPGSNYGWALARQADGKLVVAGDVASTGFGLLRYGRPRAACQAAHPLGSTLGLGHHAGTSRDSLAWKWKGGPTAPAALGDPTRSARYAACLRVGDRRERLALRGAWSARGAGYVLKNRDAAGAVDGVVRTVLRTGDRALIRMSARGPNLPPLQLPLAGPVTLRLSREDADACWEAVFDTHVARNDAGRFRATSE